MYLCDIMFSHLDMRRDRNLSSSTEKDKELSITIFILLTELRYILEHGDSFPHYAPSARN